MSASQQVISEIAVYEKEAETSSQTSIQSKRWITVSFILIKALFGAFLVFIDPPHYYFFHCFRDPDDSAAIECDINDDQTCQSCSDSNWTICHRWILPTLPLFIMVLAIFIFELVFALKLGNPVGTCHARFLKIYSNGELRKLLLSPHVLPASAICMLFLEIILMYVIAVMMQYIVSCARDHVATLGYLWGPVLTLEVLFHVALHNFSEKNYLIGFYSLFRLDLYMIYSWMLFYETLWVMLFPVRISMRMFITFLQYVGIGRCIEPMKILTRSMYQMFIAALKYIGIDGYTEQIKHFMHISYEMSVTALKYIRFGKHAAVASAPPPSNEKYDVFLTHDWGTDEFARNNHSRVSRVNKVLKEKGLVTWFDEDRMEGDIRYKMTEGIENSKVVVVFITERYISKVSGSDPRDNCNFEFWHAFDLLGVDRMIPVVMEGRMRDPTKWKGKGGGALRSKLYVDLVDDGDIFYEHVEALYSQIVKVAESVV